MHFFESVLSCQDPTFLCSTRFGTEAGLHESLSVLMSQWMDCSRKCRWQHTAAPTVTCCVCHPCAPGPRLVCVPVLMVLSQQYS